MAEVEIHTAHGHPSDPTGQRVGVMVGLIGIILSVVTIASHRAHTAAVVHKTEANDQWAFYQAKKIKEHTLEVGLALLGAAASENDKGRQAAAKFTADRERYARETEDIKKEAEQKDAESLASEKRALRFDLGEGLLELGLVLSSLYFLSRKTFFPAFGVVAAIAGALIGGSGFML
jgi:hypothetical protein